MISADQVKELREKTEVSVMACKKALEEAGGDMGKAIEILRREGVKVAEKKSGRTLKAGVVETYIHSNKQVGVMIDARCETDFVAKNESFQEFIHNLAIHIAASEPKDVDELLKQPFVKDLNRNIGDLVKENIQKFGENIEIARFIRYDIVHD